MAGLKRYVKIDRGIWDKAIFRRDVNALLVYLYLVNNPIDTIAGVIHFDYDKFEYHRPEIAREQLEAALIKLADADMIEIDGDYVRIIGYTEYQGHAGAKIEACIASELRALRGKTRFADTLSAVENTPSETQNTPSLHNITLQNKTEHNIHAPDESAAHTTAVRPRGRKAEPEAPQWVELATDCIAIIERNIKLHNISHGGIKHDSQKCARELRLLVEEDQFPRELIKPVLEWSWTHHLPDGDIYGSVLMSIERWRERRSGDQPKFFKALKSYERNGGTGAVKSAQNPEREEQTVEELVASKPIPLDPATVAAMGIEAIEDMQPSPLLARFFEGAPS